MPGRILVAIADADGALRKLNHHCEVATGQTQSEAFGWPIWEILPTPDCAEALRNGLRRTADGEDVPDQRGHWRGREGAPFPVNWGYSSLRDAQGTVHGVVVTGADMRVAGRIQAELNETLDRQQAILDTAVDGIITIDERGVVQSFNRAAERIFGYRAMEVIGANISKLMPEPYHRQHDQYLENYQLTRRKKVIGIGREAQGLRKDGTIFPLELSVGEVVTSGHRVFTGIVRDISDRRQAELESRLRHDELAHITRMHSMGDLAAGLAHEINQPLTAILGYSRACLRMIQGGSADIELLRDSMDQIARQGERAAEVIRRLRKYVEKGEVDKEPGLLDHSIAEVLALLGHEFKVNGVRVAVAKPEVLPQVLMDRIQIEQVLVNVMRNSIEAMAAAGVAEPQLQVEVAPDLAHGGLCISIRDNGPGFGSLPSEDLFAPFFTTKKDGLGQGLSICRRILTAHLGRIWAEANRPAGAVFHIWLPLAEAQEPHRPAA